MRSLLFAGVAALLIAAAVAVILLDWSEPQRKTAEPLTRETIERAKIFPREPVKKDARIIGREEFGTVEIDEEMIARLPAKPVPPRPAKTSPDPIELHRPLIERPGELRSQDVHVRLADIVSPGLEQTCSTAAESRPCGRQARTALRNFIRGRTVLCVMPHDQQEDVVRAQCTVGGKDVAEWLVEQGWAVAGDGSKYETTMKKAQEDKLGLWRYGTGAGWLPKAAPEQTAAGN